MTSYPPGFILQPPLVQRVAVAPRPRSLVHDTRSIRIILFHLHIFVSIDLRLFVHVLLSCIQVHDFTIVLGSDGDGSSPLPVVRTFSLGGPPGERPLTLPGSIGAVLRSNPKRVADSGRSHRIRSPPRPTSVSVTVWSVMDARSVPMGRGVSMALTRHRPFPIVSKRLREQVERWRTQREERCRWTDRDRRDRTCDPRTSRPSWRCVAAEGRRGDRRGNGRGRGRSTRTWDALVDGRRPHVPNECDASFHFNPRRTRRS